MDSKVEERLKHSALDSPDLYYFFSEPSPVIAKNKLDRTRWYKHRSTWMMVALLLSLLMLILAFTVAAPVVEVLLPLFWLSIFGAKLVSAMIAGFDGGRWLFLSNHRFDRFKNWLKEHPDQAIIAGVGIVLSVVGLGLMIGLSPIMASALTLACGCSVAFLVFNLVVYGPVTIADAVNNYLDRSDAEKALEQDEVEYQPFSVVVPSGIRASTSLDPSLLSQTDHPSPTNSSTSTSTSTSTFNT